MVLTAAGGFRALYSLAIDSEVFLADGQLLDQIRGELASLKDDPSSTLEELRAGAVNWATLESGRYERLIGCSDDQDRQALARRVALACAPLALRSGAWLQWLSAPGNAADPEVLTTLSLYGIDVGVGLPQASRGSAYLTLLRHLRLSEHAVPAARITQDPRIADEHFRLPALLLALSRRPDDFRPEILGADLFLRTVGLLPPLAMLKREYPDSIDWTSIDPSEGRDGDGRSALALSQEIAAGHNDSNRIRIGFGWAFAAVARWSGELYSDVDAALDPALEMAELLRQRGREGAIYHNDVLIAGRSLAEWLKESSQDPSGFLRELANSKLIKPGRPDASPLINALVGEHGPMFRVFSAADLAVIRRWIDSLPVNGASEPYRRGADSPSNPIPSPNLTFTTEPAQADEPGSIRKAYHLLLKRTVTPGARAWAEKYARDWLALSRRDVEANAKQLPSTWAIEGLRPWLRDQHDRHSVEFEAIAEAPLPPRERVIDLMVQAAPLNMIDGAWLQGFSDYEYATSEQTFFLFETYWDELGNGQPRLNHPRIFRELLTEMGQDIPPTESRDFAEWSGFEDRSFALPAYWLSIGRFPRTFRPELLGLNLAIELSGVGGTYRRAQQMLKAQGFSTLHVDIHNTIDNVATGHSAWAADAIDSYLTGLAVSDGSDALAEVYDRIRTGYQSLNPPTGYELISGLPVTPEPPTAGYEQQGTRNAETD
ncbi:iron-containing redox enzyme family protein [Nocardia sp. NPDC004604]|uniref:iron-containing redox enzyme family protein n=1 Tax=Nocardia sp. NPDC004604 TaxID=3157013 RepID=UPI00339E0324